jgi:phage host-nuclease inhibitor protein Gam
LNIKKLENDMEAEIQSITLRYRTKIDKMKAVVKILEKNEPP